MREAIRAFVIATLTAAIGIGTVSVASAIDETENVIKYRRNVMKAVGANIGNIAAVVKGEVSFVGNVATNAQVIHDLLGQATGLFPEGSSVGDTRALPAIWEDLAKFEAAANAAREAAAALVEIAQTNDVAAIGAGLQELGKACGACHKPFRKEEE